MNDDLDSVQVKVEYCDPMENQLSAPHMASSDTVIWQEPGKEGSEENSEESFKITLHPIKLFDSIPQTIDVGEETKSRAVDMLMIERIKQRRLKQLAEQ